MNDSDRYEMENWPENPYTSSVLRYCLTAEKIVPDVDTNRLLGFSLTAHMCLRKNSTYTMRDIIKASHSKWSWIPEAALLLFDRTLIPKEHFDRIADEIMECYMETEREYLAEEPFYYRAGETFTSSFDDEKQFPEEMKTKFKAKRPDLFK